MSAIVGLYNRTGQPVDPAHLAGMTDILAHRGPDGVGEWTSGPVGLGHRMLWTTPESLHETLPFADDAAGLTITADARVDNRDELLPLLNLMDRPAEMVSDSQVILAAYQKWGEDCPNHLLGDFAFAIWDEAAQKLFCACDHFGVKPLYYYQSDTCFAFASEIKALLVLPGVVARWNEVKIADYLQCITSDIKNTFFEGIFQMEAARSFTVTRTELQERHYWKLDASRELRLESPEDYAQAFREVWTEAVRCRLRSAYPVGSTLSGGIDSSAIACTARDLAAKYRLPTLHTFTAVFPSLPKQDFTATDKMAYVKTEADERHYVKAVLEAGGVEPHFFVADAQSPMTDLNCMFRHLEQPPHPNSAIFWGLCKSVQEQNVRVLLEGTDGDTVISYGYLYFKELAQAGRWLRLGRELSALGRHYSYRRSPSKEFWTYFKRYGLKPRVPLLVRKVRDRFRPRPQKAASPAPDSGVEDFIRGELSQRVALERRVQDFQGSRMGAYETEREFHKARLENPNLQFAANFFTKTGAAHQCEMRYPFLDKRVVEFCLSLPADQKLSDGWPRFIIREAMRGILPELVRQRLSKGDLSACYERGMLLHEQERLDRLFQDVPKQIDAYVSLPVMREEYTHYRETRLAQVEALSDRNNIVYKIWRVACLNSWLDNSGFPIA